MGRKSTSRKAVLKRLTLLEEKFRAQQSADKGVKELLELLRRHEAAMEELWRQPNAVASELELVQSVVKQLEEEGFWSK